MAFCNIHLPDDVEDFETAMQDWVRKLSSLFESL